MTFLKLILADRRQEQEGFERPTSVGREALRQVEISNGPEVVSPPQTSAVSSESRETTSRLVERTGRDEMSRSAEKVFEMCSSYDASRSVDDEEKRAKILQTKNQKIRKQKS